MQRMQIMLIAGEPSGDLLAGELVRALRSELTASAIVYPPDLQPLRTGLEPRFFGAGGPRMKSAGVDLALDLTEHSVTGLSDVMRHYWKFRRIFGRLYRLALENEPDAIVCVDFSGFNRRFAHAIRQYTRRRRDWFHDWHPRLIQYVSPQVWASRENRAFQLARDYDLLLSIFPFESQWYAKRVPGFPVEFVGHPLLDRFANRDSQPGATQAGSSPNISRQPRVLLLPGSRPGELKRHLPVMLEALQLMRHATPGLLAQMVLPTETLALKAKSPCAHLDVEVGVGGLPEALGRADVAVASTGTVTMECALFGVPTVTLYKTSWLTYQFAKRIAKVNSLTMPNLMARREVFPEFIQDAATPRAIATAALDLIRDAQQRQKMKTELAGALASLGGPGASRRAARAIVQLLGRINGTTTP